MNQFLHKKNVERAEESTCLFWKFKEVYSVYRSSFAKSRSNNQIISFPGIFEYLCVYFLSSNLPPGNRFVYPWPIINPKENLPSGRDNDEKFPSQMNIIPQSTHTMVSALRIHHSLQSFYFFGVILFIYSFIHSSICLFCTEVQLIYNVVSGQSDSVLYIYIYIYIYIHTHTHTHTHTYIHTYMFFFRFFSLIGYYKIMGRVPCAIQ